MKFLRSRFFNLARFKTLKSRWNEKKSFTSVSTGSYQFTPPPMQAEISSTDAINVAISTIGGLFDNITYVVYIYIYISSKGFSFQNNLRPLCINWKIAFKNIRQIESLHYGPLCQHCIWNNTYVWHEYHRGQLDACHTIVLSPCSTNRRNGCILLGGTHWQ